MKGPFYNYIALGDSYTIGESLPSIDSFPYQVVQRLRSKNICFNAPEIIAKTGWTTRQLSDAVKQYKFLSKYDFVSLLIGVNNQFQGKPIMEFKNEFEFLLQFSLKLVDNLKSRVCILSIPDYGKTPFAALMDKEKISREISEFNSFCKALSIQYKVQYIDVSESISTLSSNEIIASDQLHPSSAVYSKWAEKLSEIIADQFK
jgi:Lysophospholipase L1 and related esterases